MTSLHRLTWMIYSWCCGKILKFYFFANFITLWEAHKNRNYTLHSGFKRARQTVHYFCVFWYTCTYSTAKENRNEIDVRSTFTIQSYVWSVRVAEGLALPTSDHGVTGSNPDGGEILPEPKRRFIAQSLSCSPFHRFEMTEILSKGRKTLTHPSIQSYIRIDRFGIGYQSVIDQSNQFIHLPIIQSFKSFILLYRSIHSTKIQSRKTDEIHKRAQSVWCVSFIQFIYLINAIISYILILPIGMSLVVINFTSVVKQSQKNKM